MGWHAITVATSEAGDQVAERLLSTANDSATWSLANFGAMVIRLRLDRGERFFFSPHAAAIFRPMLAEYGADECNPPLARSLAPAKTSRIVLGFKTRWESFVPPRPATAQGIPAVPGRES